MYINSTMLIANMDTPLSCGVLAVGLFDDLNPVSGKPFRRILQIILIWVRSAFRAAARKKRKIPYG